MPKVKTYFNFWKIMELIRYKNSNNVLLRDNSILKLIERQPVRELIFAYLCYNTAGV